MLFAAGMTLIDTTDGVLMLGAYEWARVSPIRKLYYNVTITFLSAVIALSIGTIEALALIGDKLGLTATPWTVAERLSANVNSLGFWIIGLFAAAWLGSVVIYKWRGYDRIEAASVA
jgi:high-affinity nickel-transport protein